MDNLVPLKARTGVEWCKVACKGKIRWRYLYLPYHLFQQSAAATIEELVRAADPSLKALLDEAETGQRQLPLVEAAAQKEVEDRFAHVLQQAGMAKAPDAIQEPMWQAVQLLDYAVHAGMPDYSHAFQPLLRPLDDYAIQILEKRLRPRIPMAPWRSMTIFPLTSEICRRETGPCWRRTSAT